MLHAVLNAQRVGFHIFPVQARDKVPHRLAGSWGQTATNNLGMIEGFWKNIDPNANYGVACKNSGLLVVDLDQPKEDWNLAKTEWAYLHEGYGPRVSGEALFDEMKFKHGQLGDMDTFTVRTGSGGYHLYFQWPDHWPKTSQASPVKGTIDIRGNGGQWGGYVLGPGCVTASGKYEVVVDSPIALPPEWLRKLVTEKPQQPKVHRPTGIRQPGAISWSGLVDSVKNAGEGNRNNALLWAARAMCSDGAPEDEAKRVLGDAASAAGLPYFEIERTIESAYRVQRQKEGL